MVIIMDSLSSIQKIVRTKVGNINSIPASIKKIKARKSKYTFSGYLDMRELKETKWQYAIKGERTIRSNNLQVSIFTNLDTE